MISSGRVLVRVRGTGAYLSNVTVNVCNFSYDPLSIYGRERADVEKAHQWFRDNPGFVDAGMLEIVDAPACCCGTTSGLTVKGWTYGGKLQEVAPGVWRCDKHVGRQPCIIDGCGRTFAGAVGQEYLCGTHFREAPRHMRDRLKKLHRRGEKMHWPRRMLRLYEQAWRLVVRTVREGRQIDVAEINALMGWD